MEQSQDTPSTKDINYHCKDAIQLCVDLGTDPSRGLSSAQVAEQRKKYGDNKLPEPKRASKLKMFLTQLMDFMVIILIVSSGVSIAFGDIKAAIVLLIVVVINIAIGFTEELKADSALAGLISSRLSEQDTNVTRDGHVLNIKSSDVVVGDLVNLEEGEQVPADLRLVHISHLQIDESSLTGESIPVDKDDDIIEAKNTPLAERNNMAYMMTLVARGRGMGVVVRTGVDTEVGKSSQAMEQDSKRKKTNLQKKLSKLGKWLVLLAIVLCGIVTGLGVYNGNDLKQMVETGVSLAVSVIPEGLVAVTTVTMAVGVQQMAKRKAIVRQLPAVEVLGAVSVICSDKTGTLTEGKMKGELLWVGGGIYYISGSGIVPEGALYVDSEYKKKVENRSESLEKALLVCGLCNNASVYQSDENVAKIDPIGKAPSDVESGEKDHLIPKHTSKDSIRSRWYQNEQRRASQIRTVDRALGRRGSSLVSVEVNRNRDHGWKTVGTPTELALQVAAMKCGFGKEELEQRGWKFVRDIPFDSERKRMSVVYKSPEGKTYAFSKGAAEFLIPQCTQFYTTNEVVPLTQAEKDDIEKQCLIFSAQGMRVLALAYHQWEGSEDTDEATIEKNLRFLGLIGLMDPPRKEVGPSIKDCHKAGIKVVMITGDNPITAESIAKNLKLMTDSDDKAICMKTGAEVDEMSDEQLAALSPFPSVFARVTPEVKLRIVTALQQQEKIVAFIGDGVNDAASIKRADVGVAMGITGTDVSQQSADIILSDDNFNHIVVAIEEGRRIYDNVS